MSQERFQPADHFRAEVQELQRSGRASWAAVAALTDADLRDLARTGQASEARLRRLRGQARLIQDAAVTAAQASLLLHGGIPDAAALAEADPDRLLRQLSRFQRQLLGRHAATLDIGVVRTWIATARRRRRTASP